MNLFSTTVESEVRKKDDFQDFAGVLVKKKVRRSSLELKKGLTSELNSFQSNQVFFTALEIGSKHDYEIVKTLILKDPKRNLYEKGHSQLLVNSRNARGETPLHVAIKNNNLEIVKLLISYGANVHILSFENDEKGIQESNLDVAIRWNLVEILRYLLSEHKWSEKEIEIAYKKCSNKEAKQQLKKYLAKNYKKSCTIY